MSCSWMSCSWMSCSSSVGFLVDCNGILQRPPAPPPVQSFLDQCFGMGLLADLGRLQGRLLHRSVNEALGLEQLSHRHPGGTRKFTYLAESASRFLRKFRGWVRSIDARKRQKEEEHRGDSQLGVVERDVIEGCRPLHALLRHMLGRGLEDCSPPYAFLVQKLGVIASCRIQAQQSMFTSLATLKDELQGIAKLVLM